MLLRRLCVYAAFIGAAASAAAAQTPLRIDDDEVGNGIHEVKRRLDRFVTRVASDVPAIAATRGQPETELRAALNGLRTSSGRLETAYRPPDRPATAELAALLRYAKTLDAMLEFGPGMTDAALQWAQVVESLVHLGKAYRIDWQKAPVDWAPRRICDQELRLAAVSLRAAVGDLVGALDSTLKKDQTLEATEKARASKQLAAFLAAADGLAKVRRYDDLMTTAPKAVRAAAGLKPFMETYAGAAPVGGQWQSATKALDTIAQACGLVR